MCKNLSNHQKHLIDLQPGETIISMKVYQNLLHKFVCGISLTTSMGRTFGTFGQPTRIVRDVKSPYQTGYYIASFVGSAGDVLMDLRGNFASTYASPFLRGNLAESEITPDTTTSTISSRGSGASGYHTDEDFTLPKTLAKKLGKSKPPPPPPRYVLKSLKSETLGIPRKTSRKGQKGAILMQRPILAK